MYLFHDSSLSFGESCISSQFIVNKLHLDLDTTLGLLPIRGWGFFGLDICIVIVVVIWRTAIVVIIVLTVIIGVGVIIVDHWRIPTTPTICIQ
jgi:hypothetical protein